MRLLCLISVLWLVSAWGQATPDFPQGAVSGWGACRVDVPSPLPVPDSDVPDGELEVISGKVEFNLSGDARFTDEIVLRSGNNVLRADGAEYNSLQGVFSVEGGVEFRAPGKSVQAKNAEFNKNTGNLKFESAEFQIWTVPARGVASRIEVESEGLLRLEEVAYTSCPVGNDDWMLRARKIEIDQNTGIGTARGARLRFKGVPLLYFPYITYPVTNQRKTGLLIPDFGTSNSRGVDLAFPFYWNIAPRYDLTFTPRYMSRRGLQANTDFRYLARNTDGILTGEYLPDDDGTSTDRWLYKWFNQTRFFSDWRTTVDVVGVSDSNYFEDLSRSLRATSQTNLRRHMDIEFYNNAWSGLLQVQNFQTIDDSITAVDKPYTTLPHLAVRGFSPHGLFGLQYTLDGALTYFDRNAGVTGLRGRIRPEIALPIHTRFIDIAPSVAIDHTQYDLNKTLPDESDEPSRTLPIFGVDLTSVFERITNRQQWLQTLEPHLMYAYIPFRNQDDIPVFDTIVPDLNVVQLFRKNRFVGYDRIGDTNQLTAGLSTRLINASDGDEFLRATVGAIRFFSTNNVTLPGVVPRDNHTSDYLAELSMKLFGNWRTKLGYQWNSDERKTELGEARLLYQRDDFRIANISYRFRQDLLEEVDVALAWPLPGPWNFIGSYDFSIEDSQTLETVVGLEYETCCWAIRTNFRRTLASRDGNLDNSISLQLLLKGFGSPDSGADRLLDRGILGYD